MHHASCITFEIYTVYTKGLDISSLYRYVPIYLISHVIEKAARSPHYRDSPYNHTPITLDLIRLLES